MQIIRPNIAGFRTDIPASPLNATLHILLRTAAPMITPKSHFQFLFHAAVSSMIKKRGTARLINILGAVQVPLRYSISKAKNSITLGMVLVGAGNQNMLVNNANMEANMPV